MQNFCQHSVFSADCD